MSDELELRVGATYRAKRDVGNHRTIIWMGGNKVQYDGPAVKIGQRYPKVTRESFLRWAAEEITDE